MTFQRMLFFIAALVSAGTHAGQDPSDFSIPAPAPDAMKSQQLWATHYFVHAALSVPNGVPFRDKSGKAISDGVPPRDWCLAAIEGTVHAGLSGEPRTLNYGGAGAKVQVDCASVLKINPLTKPWITSTGKSYFTKAIGTYGDGVAGYRLVPFRTVAVDRKTFPYGTAIFIPKARGVEIELPSGATAKHDGYFFAGDTGGAIKGSQIDIFCGITNKNCLPQFVKSDEGAKFEAVVVTDKAIIERLAKMHKE